MDEHKRLGAALGYVFTPVVPLLLMTGPSGNDPLLRRHAGQALIWSVGLLIGLAICIVLAIFMIRASIWMLFLLPLLFAIPFIPGALWAWNVYHGSDVRIAGITSLATRFFPVRDSEGGKANQG